MRDMMGQLLDERLGKQNGVLSAEVVVGRCAREFVIGCIETRLSQLEVAAAARAPRRDGSSKSSDHSSGDDLSIVVGGVLFQKLCS